MDKSTQKKRDGWDLQSHTKNRLASHLGGLWPLLVFSLCVVPAWAGIASLTNEDLASMDSLKKALRGHREIDSPEAFMESLPESYRAGYSLVFRSGGLEPFRVSLKTPRVILHGDRDKTSLGDGRLLMTFTYGSNKVEMMAYRDGSFRRQLIEFPKGNRPSQFLRAPEPRGAIAKKIARIEGSREFIHRAPPKRVRFDHKMGVCVKCHTSGEAETRFLSGSLRPNWDPYPIWPGTFGEHHPFYESPQEEKALADFQQQGAKQGFYRFLPGIEKVDLHGMHRQNFQLSMKISDKNADRIFRHLKSDPEFSKYKMALLAALAMVPDFIDYIPDAEEFQRKKWQEEYEGRKTELRAQLAQFEKTRLKRQRFPLSVYKDEVLDVDRWAAFATVYRLMRNKRSLKSEDFPTLFKDYYGGRVPAVFKDGSTGIESILVREFVKPTMLEKPELGKAMGFVLSRPGASSYEIITHFGSALVQMTSEQMRKFAIGSGCEVPMKILNGD